MDQISEKVYTKKQVQLGLTSGRFVAMKPCSELKLIVLQTHGNAQMSRNACFVNLQQQPIGIDARRLSKRKSTNKGEKTMPLPLNTQKKRMVNLQSLQYSYHILE